MPSAVILVRSPKALVAPKVKEIEGVKDAFDVRGRFDAVAVVEVADYADLRRVALQIQCVEGVKRTESMVEL